MKFNLILCLICSIILTNVVYSQQITVYNLSTKESINNVAIYNSKKNRSTITDYNGKADLSQFAQNDTLFFQHTSFQPAHFTLDEIKTLNYKIFLKKRIILMDEFIISASKSKENKKNIAHMTDVLDPVKLELIPSQTSSDILLSTGNIFVQKSQGGGGSPIIRGFEANKILLVVDGVRMNNAIYRTGHLQNSITIDRAILERTEIIYGPNSTIYGSDALGGVIHYITRDPELANENQLVNLSANAYGQLSSANQAQVAHLDFNLGSKRLGSLTSFTYSNYGNIKMGRSRNPFYENIGLCENYVDQVNGVDSTFVNPDPEIQKNTSYSQYDFVQKLKYSPTENVDVIANIQYSTSSEVPRYDVLNDYKGNNLEYAEWYYGPQNRLLASVKSVVKAQNFLFNYLTGTAAYQRIDEDRIDRKFRIADRLHQEEDVNVYSLNLDLFKLLANTGKINYGLEYTYNTVYSNAFYENINTGEREPAITRYPDGGSDINTLSAYINYKKDFLNKYLLSGGMRYSYANLWSKFSNELLPLPFSTVTINNGALTGSVSLIYHPLKDLQFMCIASTGYRNPNVDDYGKVRVKGDDIIIPNNSLKPEYTYNLEFGISKTFDGYIQINGNIFVSYLTEAIVRTYYALPNGIDSLEYDGDYYNVTANTNSDEALIHGVSLSLVSDLNSNLSFRSTLNYVHGRDISQNVPMAHITPIFGKTTIGYKIKKFNNELYVFYNGWKYAEDMSPFGEDNEDEGTDYGFPAWFTINFRTSVKLNPHITLQLAVENLLDTFYKPFASGVAAPGRNFLATLRFHV
ncbi:MAG: TonB-dependent receptor [Bacteroidales bacterium]|nr:TonB-dependent receptor [Bacteroidales bacterium]